MRAREEWQLDLPTSHRIPLTWLLQHGGPSVRYRTLSELAPAGSVDRATLTEALTAAVLSPPVSAVTTRQQENGMWGTNYLGYGPSPRDNIEEAGTVAQYRRLIQLGLPRTTRPFRLAERLMFRTLSRDPDLLLYGEFADAAEEDPRYAEWYRYQVREGVNAALAEAGHQDDPRLRGSAHKVASAVSAFLRSPQAEDALIKRSGGWQLPPDVIPPSWWSLAMFAAMPSLQRERAGFMDRLGQYLVPAVRDAQLHDRHRLPDLEASSPGPRRPDRSRCQGSTEGPAARAAFHRAPREHGTDCGCRERAHALPPACWAISMPTACGIRRTCARSPRRCRR